MNNFSIDASVYAFPHEGNIPDEVIEDFAKTVRDLYDIIIDRKRPHYVHFYLFKKDIDLLWDKNLDLTKLSPSSPELIEARMLLDKVINPIRIGKDISEYIGFENYFNIEKINFEPPPEFYNNIPNVNNIELKKNIVKNIALIATLNQYVYKNYETHNIVWANNKSALAPITTKHFSITMNKHSGKNDDGSNYLHTHRIKNFPPGDPPNKENIDIIIFNQDVKFTTLKMLKKNNFNCKIQNCWEDAFNSATENEEFGEYIDFGAQCREGIEQYVKTIEIEEKKMIDKNKPEDEKKLVVIKNWKEQFPTVLYENIKGLYDSIKVLDKPKKPEADERYNDNCRSTCDNYKWCGSTIRLFGLDCVDDKKKHKKHKKHKNITLDPQNEYRIKDRTKTAGEEPKQYWNHLRIYNPECDDPLWFLCLRLYFRWIADKKIQIGWIGRHLYQPCHKYKTSNSVPNCKRPFDCPLNKESQKNGLYNPIDDELTNFLKQYPQNH